MRINPCKYIAVGLTALLSACAGQSGKLRIEGDIEGVNEQDFLIVSTDGGLHGIDTLHVRSGELDYQCDLEGDATYHIVFSNGKDLVVWGHSGDVVTLEGKQDDLKNIKVEGNKENKLYTKFRLKSNTLSQTDSLEDAAHQFITENASSPVAVEVYRQYFFSGKPLKKQYTEELLEVLKEKQPENKTLSSYENALKKRKILQPGHSMPDFDLTDTEGTHHRLADYRGKYLMLIIWAGWQSSNNSAFTQVQELMNRGASDRLEVLTISLDVERTTMEQGMHFMEWPTIGNLDGWDMPYVKKIGVRTIPYCILVDPQGKIVAHGANFVDDLKPSTNKIFRN